VGGRTATATATATTLRDDRGFGDGAGLNLASHLRTIPPMADSADKAGGFTVTDRRSFAADGERKDTAETPAQAPERAAEAAPATAPAPASAPAPTPAPGKRSRGEVPRELPPADFATLVLSLGSSAIMYLGEDPQGNQTERNLPMAKHAIDLLSVLEDKTKGNLSAEEAHILESLLFDLRLRYVEALKGSPTGAA
jgi:hypothetical protein